jgi:hypothetical protein
MIAGSGQVSGLAKRKQSVRQLEQLIAPNGQTRIQLVLKA